ncbi:MAG: hypothetical protein OSA24_08805 [Longimicrobiales bacterium]|nr:hypothetical protein [Longimicrobiales bacterium]
MEHSVKICGEFWPNGRVKSFGLIKGGEWHGDVQGFWDNGKPDFRQTFKQGITNGPYEFFFPNGQLEEVGVFKGGEHCGVTESFTIDGQLRQVLVHKPTSVQGLWPVRHQGGILIDRGSSFEILYDDSIQTLTDKLWD